MEPFSSSQGSSKIIPLARKKLLNQALLKDSPLKLSLNKRKFGKHSAHNSIYNLENSQKIVVSSSVIVSPLKEKDMNHEVSIIRPHLKKSFIKEKPKEKWTTNIPNYQDFFIKLWKSSKMSTEVTSTLQLEVERAFFSQSFKKEMPKTVHFISELNQFLIKSNSFPDFLTPYLEEIVCCMPISYPLIIASNTPFEAECLLSLSICRFSIQKIKKNESSNAKSLAYILLLLISEIDTNLQDSLKKIESVPWEMFIEYSSNPGLLVQNIRKIPEKIRKFFIKTIQKAYSLYLKLSNVEEKEGVNELNQLLSEIFEFNGIICKSVTHEVKSNRLKRLVKDPSSNSSRSSTPQTQEKTIKTKKVSHSRSFSNTITLKRSASADKRLQFLQSSRFNKRVLDKLTEKLVEKMKEEPDYLVDMKEKDLKAYLKFKEEFIEIHKENWMQECIQSLERSEMLMIQNEEDLKLIDAKKEAFFSYVCNSQLLRSIIFKAKSIVLDIKD